MYGFRQVEAWWLQSRRPRRCRSNSIRFNSTDARGAGSNAKAVLKTSSLARQKAAGACVVPSAAASDW